MLGAFKWNFAHFGLYNAVNPNSLKFTAKLFSH